MLFDDGGIDCWRRIRMGKLSGRVDNVDGNEKALFSQGEKGFIRLAPPAGLKFHYILFIFNILNAACFQLTHKPTLFL